MELIYEGRRFIDTSDLSPQKRKNQTTEGMFVSPSMFAHAKKGLILDSGRNGCGHINSTLQAASNQ